MKPALDKVMGANLTKIDVTESTLLILFLFWGLKKLYFSFRSAIEKSDFYLDPKEALVLTTP